MKNTHIWLYVFNIIPSTSYNCTLASGVEVLWFRSSYWPSESVMFLLNSFSVGKHIPWRVPCSFYADLCYCAKRTILQDSLRIFKVNTVWIKFLQYAAVILLVGTQTQLRKGWFLSDLWHDMKIVIRATEMSFSRSDRIGYDNF